MKKKPELVEDVQFGVRWKPDSVLGQMPPGVHRDIARRAFLARHNIGKEVSRFEHRKEIIRTLWPDFTWHSWADRMLQSTCEHHFTTWIGPASSGKTSVAAIAALEWWLEDPENSAVIVCSTTMNMLRRRIWGDIVKWHSKLPREAHVGELLDTACFIRIKDGDWKNGIKGIAIQDGPVEQAVADIVGMHTKRVWVLLDEAQEVREAIMEARYNLQKNPESRMHIMGNPESLTSLLCRYGAPKEGWDTISKFTPEWETKTHGYDGTGKGLFFDGRKSPAVLDSDFAKRCDWMINAKQIERHLEDTGWNENDPRFMSQSIGWPPSMGIESTILDGAILLTFRCQSPPVWTHGKTACAFLDPAYEGADKAILQFGWRGWVEDDEGKRWVIGFGEDITVPIDAESESPIHFQIMRFCKEQCEARRIPPNEFGLFATGEGGGLKAIFDEHWGRVVGIEEGGSPTERNVGSMGKTAKQEYDTRASELCFLLREFALGNSIRNLPEKAADQATKRQTFHRAGKWCAEPKTGSKGRVDASGKAVRGFKQRLGYSPDNFDAAMGLCELCRLAGAEPGPKSNDPNREKQFKKQLNEADSAYDESVYTQEDDWSESAIGF